MAPEIENYRFGSMEIDGETYDGDVIIFPDGVYYEWWRDEGHYLQPADLEKVIEADPDKVIIGNGYYQRMEVPEEAVEFLEENGIEVEIASTKEAWKRFNEERGEGVVGAFHLTC